MTRVCVIGGGAAGALVALGLLASDRPFEINLVEPEPRLGVGLAYRTGHPLHLLNVASGQMSAFVERPDDFNDWLGLPAGATEFVSRRLFGEYLSSRLAEAVAAAPSGQFCHVRSEAIALSQAESSVNVRLLDGSELVADHAVLAVGAPRKLDPLPAEVIAAAGRSWIPDPWAPHAFDQVRAGERILILGSGLTMVDVTLELAERDAHIAALSRHGLLPRAHAEHPVANPTSFVPSAGSLSELTRSLRAEASRSDWRTVVDGLRAHTPGLWAELSSGEQEQFFRHLGPYWNVHRHRLPPASGARVDELLRSGRLVVRAGTLLSVQRVGTELAATIASRGDRRLTETQFNHLVNATGPSASFLDHAPPVLQRLLETGQARIDRHGFGIDCDSRGRMIAVDGSATSRILVIGAMRRGGLFESTAIREIRAQATQIREQIELDARSDAKAA